MNRELFYSENLLPQDETLQLGSEESRHLIKVLRKKPGDFIFVTNGQGLEWKGEITGTDARKVSAKKIETVQHINERAPLHIAIAPPKSNDRMEWFLEKATEIGVSQITPIICKHSERKTLKMDRMKKILVGGLKQSGQYFLPQFNPLVSFDSFLKTNPTEKRMIAHCQAGDKIALFQIQNLNEGILILIGPEGDFSDQEIERAINQSFTAISLGSQRLRTETAGIVACSKVATLREISKKLV